MSRTGADACGRDRDCKPGNAGPGTEIAASGAPRGARAARQRRGAADGYGRALRRSAPSFSEGQGNRLRRPRAAKNRGDDARPQSAVCCLTNCRLSFRGASVSERTRNPETEALRMALDSGSAPSARPGMTRMGCLTILSVMKAETQPRSSARKRGPRATQKERTGFPLARERTECVARAENSAIATFATILPIALAWN